MDKIRVIDAINNSDLDYSELYNSINIIDKEKTCFDPESYREIVYLSMYLYHVKKGIHTLSKNGNIPEIVPKEISYGQFKKELEIYKSMSFYVELLPDISNVFQELNRLASDKLLHQGYWTKIYSSFVTGNELQEAGKIYVSIDNSYLYQFACLMLTNCLKKDLYDYEFKVNNDSKINRADNLVIYFTTKNLNTYLDIIEELKQQYPNFRINCSHMLGKEISDGVVIAKDYKDGSSFTEKICKTILGLKKQGYDTETVVEAIDGSIDKHLESVLSLISDNEMHHKKI